MPKFMRVGRLDRRKNTSAPAGRSADLPKMRRLRGRREMDIPDNWKE